MDGAGAGGTEIGGTMVRREEWTERMVEFHKEVGEFVGMEGLRRWGRDICNCRDEDWGGSSGKRDPDRGGGGKLHGKPAGRSNEKVGEAGR